VHVALLLLDVVALLQHSSCFSLVELALFAVETSCLSVAEREGRLRLSIDITARSVSTTRPIFACRGRYGQRQSELSRPNADNTEPDGSPLHGGAGHLRAGGRGSSSQVMKLIFEC
jgi:hypothetical protein